MKALAWLVAVVVVFLVVYAGVLNLYDLHVWHQIEKQALVADLVEGNQE